MIEIFSTIQKKAWWAGLIVLLAAVGLFFGLWRQNVQAVSRDERVITIHDGNEEKVVITKESTVASVLKQAKIKVLPDDTVDPMTDTKLIANAYQINVYRARPVLVIDGNTRQTVMTPYDTGRQIIEKSGLSYYDEDKVSLERSNDILQTDGAAETLRIKRATVFNFMLYGKAIEARTQAKTVSAMMKEKNIKLGKDDTVSLPLDTPITAGMKIEIWRNGKQTLTQEEPIAFTVQQVKDANQPVGYRQIKNAGVNGKKMVTYEVEMKNGQEVARKEIQSVQTQAPQEQVEVIGTKPSFSGDFAAALAKLRACEAGGNYANKRNPNYRGAYQFGYGTWANYGGYYDPADAPPEVQDQAARALYERRGWQPWPHCGSSLPDTFR